MRDHVSKGAKLLKKGGAARSSGWVEMRLERQAGPNEGSLSLGQAGTEFSMN